MLHCSRRRMAIPLAGGHSPSQWPWDGFIALARQVSCYDSPNFERAKIPISSKFNLPLWEQYLQAYHDKIIVDFLRYGWPINYASHDTPVSTMKNHSSALTDVHILHSYTEKELEAQAICGPYHCNPFASPCSISPLQCVPKRDSDLPRVVHDLSFPEGQSVCFIFTQPCPLVYVLLH